MLLGESEPYYLPEYYEEIDDDGECTSKFEGCCMFYYGCDRPAWCYNLCSDFPDDFEEYEEEVKSSKAPILIYSLSTLAISAASLLSYADLYRYTESQETMKNYTAVLAVAELAWLPTSFLGLYAFLVGDPEQN